MNTPRIDTKQFNTFGHSLPLLQDEHTGKELVKSSRKREDDIFKIDGKQRFHGAFTGGFSAGHWNTVGSAEGWAPQEFKSSRKEKGSKKRQRPQDFMDDDDFGEFGIAHRKIQARADFGKADVFADSGVKDSDALKFTLGLGLAAATRIVSGSESNWGNKLLRKLGWKDGQGIGARKRAKQSEVHGNLGKRIGPAMPSRDALEASQPITFAPKDCCPISFQAKSDNKGLGFKGVSAFGSQMATNSKALSVTVEGRKMNIAGQAFGVGALEEEDSDIYAQDSMMNYNFDIKTEKEVLNDKRRAKIEEDNKFRSRFALKGPKIEGGYNDALEGFVRGRPVKKKNKIKMLDIPRGYTGEHTFDHDCKSAIIIHACQDIARSVDEMASKYKVNIPSYVKGGKNTQLSVEQRAHMLHEPAPNIKKEEPKEQFHYNLIY
jgi:hypothetical protein